MRCSNAKSPRNFWPAMFTLTPRPATRKYCPAAITTDCVSPPTRKVSSTAMPLLLISNSSEPETETDGMFTETSPPTRPAMPVGVRTNAPLTFDKVRKSFVPSPKEMPALATATLVTAPPSGAVICSKTKSP